MTEERHNQGLGDRWPLVGTKLGRLVHWLLALYEVKSVGGPRKLQVSDWSHHKALPRGNFFILFAFEGNQIIFICPKPIASAQQDPARKRQC